VCPVSMHSGALYFLEICLRKGSVAGFERNQFLKMTTSSQNSSRDASINQGSGDFGLLIFDCDGVLVDSEKYSCGAWNVLLREMFNGLEVGSDYGPILGKSDRTAALWYGQNNPQIQEWLCPKDNLLSEERLVELTKRKLETYYRIAENNLKTFPGLHNVVEQAKQLGWPVVVGSSGTHEKIRWSLKQVNILGLFDDITSAQDVARGKPFPDLFLEAARKSKISSHRSIVIEDSKTGLEAAKSAGSFAIAITTTYPREELEPLADLVIDSFLDLDLKQLKRA